MKDPKVIWAWVGGVIVLIAVVAGLVWHFNGGNTPASSVATSPVPVQAPSGQLVAGFPPELVLDNASSAGIGSSYSINYSSSTKQYTAQWSSVMAPGVVYSDYEAYIKANSWKITNQGNLGSIKSIVATNATSEFYVQIMGQSNSNGSKIVLTYLAQ